MTIRIIWKADYPPFTDGRYTLRLATGVTQAVQNRLAWLKLWHPHRALEVEQEFYRTTEGVTLDNTPTDGSPLDFIPVITHFSAPVVDTVFEVVVIYGLVATRHTRREGYAEWRYLVCLPDQADEVLETVFDFTPTLRAVVEWWAKADQKAAVSA